MKRIAVSVILVLACASAFAGKEERDFKAKEVEPMVKTSMEAFKKGCGCALAFNVNWDSFKKKDQMYQIKYMAENIGTNAPTYCDTAETKKAVCALKSIDLSVAAETDFKFENGKGTATTDGNSYATWDMISRAVDK